MMTSFLKRWFLLAGVVLAGFNVFATVTLTITLDVGVGSDGWVQIQQNTGAFVWSGYGGGVLTTTMTVALPSTGYFVFSRKLAGGSSVNGATIPVSTLVDGDCVTVPLGTAFNGSTTGTISHGCSGSGGGACSDKHLRVPIVNPTLRTLLVTYASTNSAGGVATGTFSLAPAAAIVVSIDVACPATPGTVYINADETNSDGAVTAPHQATISGTNSLWQSASSPTNSVNSNAPLPSIPADVVSKDIAAAGINYNSGTNSAKDETLQTGFNALRKALAEAASGENQNDQDQLAKLKSVLTGILTLQTNWTSTATTAHSDSTNGFGQLLAPVQLINTNVNAASMLAHLDTVTNLAQAVALATNLTGLRVLTSSQGDQRLSAEQAAQAQAAGLSNLVVSAVGEIRTNTLAENAAAATNHADQSAESALLAAGNGKLDGISGKLTDLGTNLTGLKGLLDGTSNTNAPGWMEKLWGAATNQTAILKNGLDAANLSLDGLLGFWRHVDTNFSTFKDLKNSGSDAKYYVTEVPATQIDEAATGLTGGNGVANLPTGSLVSMTFGTTQEWNPALNERTAWVGELTYPLLVALESFSILFLFAAEFRRAITDFGAANQQKLLNGLEGGITLATGPFWVAATVAMFLALGSVAVGFIAQWFGVLVFSWAGVHFPSSMSAAMGMLEFFVPIHFTVAIFLGYGVFKLAIDAAVGVAVGARVLLPSN